jgi:hypothetical protein
VEEIGRPAKEARQEAGGENEEGEESEGVKKVWVCWDGGEIRRIMNAREVDMK